MLSFLKSFCHIQAYLQPTLYVGFRKQADTQKGKKSKQNTREGT